MQSGVAAGDNLLQARFSSRQSDERMGKIIHASCLERALAL